MKRAESEEAKLLVMWVHCQKIQRAWRLNCLMKKMLLKVRKTKAGEQEGEQEGEPAEVEEEEEETVGRCRLTPR
jgi:hypothetical protein